MESVFFFFLFLLLYLEKAKSHALFFVLLSFSFLRQSFCGKQSGNTEHQYTDYLIEAK